MLYNISDPSIVVYLLHIHGYYYYFYLKYYADLSWLCSVGTCIVRTFNFRLTSSRILSIKKLREIIYNCKTPSEHAFSDTRLIGNALLTSFLFYTLSLCGPTPGDYKLRNQSNTLSLIGALSKKLCSGVV